MELYSTIYKKLLKVIPDLPEHIAQGKHYGKSQLNSSGMMDLSFDYLREDEKGNPIIALAHHFEQNGDLVSDPDMEIRIFPKMKMAEAMTFQDQFGYRRIYEFRDGKEFVSPKLKKDLNGFLNQWLTNIIRQGHRIDLSEQKKSVTPSHISLKGKQNYQSLKNLNKMTNTENKNQINNESKMYFIEKAQWKKGEDILTIVVGEKNEDRDVVGYVRLEGYDENKKPILISTGLDGNELFPVSNNLFEVKKQFKDNEKRLTQVMEEYEHEQTEKVEELIERQAVPLEDPERTGSETDDLELEDGKQNPQLKKENEVKDIRQQKGKSAGKTR